MMKLRWKRFFRSSFKLNGGAASAAADEIRWERRPGGMLVQKRECKENSDEVITIRVSTVSYCHHISIQATSTFGELKILLSLLTNLEAEEQRVLFKGKEREGHEYLHMVGVTDGDKLLMLEDPAIKEMKLLGLPRTRMLDPPHRTISAN